MPDRRQHVYATLRYADAPAAMQWLASTLGFADHQVISNDDGTIAHAELAFGEDLIMLGSFDPARHSPGGPITIYLVRPDIDDHYAMAQASGADVTMEIHDTDYGSREYAVQDPEGNTWSVGTYQPSAG